MERESPGAATAVSSTSQRGGCGLVAVLMFLVVALALIILGNSERSPERPITAIGQAGAVGEATATGQPASQPIHPPAVAATPDGQMGEPARSEQTGSQTIQISLPERHELPVSYGDLGPQLLAAGAIDYERFVALYEQIGRPLTGAQKEILTAESDEPIIFDHHNAHFLLNFFWAVGLTNQNPILTAGPLMQQSNGEIGRFASTGGWTLGRQPATALYASAPLIPLTAAQQARLEAVAYNVYRPCCNNHTAFADCNHGLAMLGLLALLASQDATEDEMFSAARYANTFWFPQQAMETAIFFKLALDQDFDEVDPRLAVGPELFSATGFQQLQGWLVDKGLLNQPPGGGASCGVS